MRPIMIDTNAYSAFKQGHPSIIEVIKHTQIIGVSPIVIGEILGGFENGPKIIKNRQELHDFLGSPRIKIYELTLDTSNAYSHVYSRLKKKGKPIPTNDMWIAAQALENGCSICSFDKHFHHINGLICGTTLEHFML